MTKSQKTKQISKFIDEGKELLSLQGWDIDFNLLKDHGGTAAASINLSHVYKHATITFYDCVFQKENNLRQIVIHELAHCLTEPLYVYCFDLVNGRLRSFHDVEDQREILTEIIAKIACKIKR